LTYYFDATSGKLVTSAPTTGYGQCSAHSNNYLKVTIANDGTVTLEWSGGSDLHGNNTDTDVSASK
jgi:hypothetical protein